MQTDDRSARELRGLEEMLLDADFRRSDRVAGLLADEFLEFGSSGAVYDKRQVISFLQAESPARITGSDFGFRQLAPDVVLVTFRACRQAERPVHTLRSSIWRRVGGGWQLLFHQGTVTAAGEP